MKILKKFINKNTLALEEILNDPIKSYQIMDKINEYKKSIINGKLIEIKYNNSILKEI